MRIPTFSRHSEPDKAEAERPAATATGTTPVRPRRDSDDTTVTDLKPAPPAPPASTPARPAPTGADRPLPPPPPPSSTVTRPETERVTRPETERDGAVTAAGPKPRASLLATLGLVLGVASALLVLSGPLLGYGIGVAGLALVLSLAGIRATSKRHVAGKSDALIGMVLSLGAIVLGVLALTGSLTWLGTDVQPVNNLREWLDAQFVNRF